MVSNRLARELTLLYAAEAAHKIPAAPVVRQLVAADSQPLPDLLPSVPPWTRFHWPATGAVNFDAYWKDVDGGQVKRWAGPFL